MQIVIDINEEDFKCLENGIIISLGRGTCKSLLSRAMNAIIKGTPLPKGHGRLIDADYLKDVILLHNFHGNNKDIVPYQDRRGYRARQKEVDESIINAPTIIEADKEGENVL